MLTRFKTYQTAFRLIFHFFLILKCASSMYSEVLTLYQLCSAQYYFVSMLVIFSNPSTLSGEFALHLVQSV